MRSKLFLILLTFSSLSATQEFNLESMKQYLTQENPYIYQAIANKYITQEQLNYVQGAYDTKLVAKYDEKKYPYTDGSYYGASLEKPTESGIDFSAGYRYASGTQEYNNIKTGKNGEFIVGAKLPIIKLLNQIDERRLRVGLTKMNLKNRDYEYKEAMRAFYFQLMSDYYLLLQDKELMNIAQNMLQKIEKRQHFIETKVIQGNLPEIVLLEASQQVINAKQGLILTKRAYENRLTELLKYLNLSKEKFSTLYHLPKLPQIQEQNFDFEESLQKALKKRSDLQILNTEIEKLLLQNKDNERKKYPELNLGVYGVQDVNEESGFKLSLNLTFPLEQSQYSGKNAEIRENIKLINTNKELRILELQADLEQIINSLGCVKQNISNAQKETTLLQRLESAERRKYELGSSTLFLLNQREILTMQTQKKLLHYKLEYQLLFESYKRLISTHSLES